MGTLANSEDQDKMLHNAAFHQGLHCLVRHRRSSGKEIQCVLEVVTCDPAILTTDHPDVAECSFMEKNFCLKRVN